jgi:hypothetical protein
MSPNEELAFIEQAYDNPHLLATLVNVTDLDFLMVLV